MEDKFYIAIGELIRKERRAKNYSQEYMAAKLHITQNSYSKIESGKTRCSAFKIICIFNLLELDQDILFGLNG